MSELVGKVYGLDVPEEPPIGTVVVDARGRMHQRVSSGWQTTGALLSQGWVIMLRDVGPVQVIRVPKES